MNRLRPLPDPDHLPALDARYALARPASGLGSDQPAPRILLLYGSLRERSYSRLCCGSALKREPARAPLTELISLSKSAQGWGKSTPMGTPSWCQFQSLIQSRRPESTGVPRQCRSTAAV